MNARRNDLFVYAENPAKGKMWAVRFVRWLNKEHTYARVERLDTGEFYGVSATRLHA